MSKSATITWTPVNTANSTGQIVQYRKKSDTDWTNYGTVGKAVSTATINGLLDNIIYLFRITDVCAVGGPTPGAADERIGFTCPVITTTKTYQTINFDFDTVGGDIDQYKVELRSSDDATLLASATPTNLTGKISGMFPGLNPASGYRVRVLLRATGSLGAYSNTCASILVTTDPAPSCNAPTNIVASLV